VGCPGIYLTTNKNQKEAKNMKEQARYALRLPASTMEELKKVVAAEGTTINQFINSAVTEKLSALRTVEYFTKRAGRANMEAFWQILEQAGSEEPQAGDEL
jgi:hypothetical protein